MSRLSLIALLSILITSCGHTYYVVRHAEKAQASTGTTMSSPNDPPLSAEGAARAEALKIELEGKKIKTIYSTKTIRTMTTAEPLAKAIGISIQNYGPRPDSAFINQLKTNKKNVLIVGHSNTVDEIVNGLTGQQSVAGDLQDSEYDNLFIIKYKGKKVSYVRKKYGVKSN